MKSVLMLLIILGAAVVEARPVVKETIACKGVGESSGYSVLLRAKSQSDIENKAIAYWVSVDEPEGIGYDGLVFGYKNDVMLNLKPRKNDSVRLTGTIFMDDLDQVLTYERGDGKKVELELQCGSEE